MFNKKKTIMILLSLFVCLIVISSVSAEENITDDEIAISESGDDIITVEEDSTIAIDEKTDDAITINEETDDTIASEEQEELSMQTTEDDVLGDSPSYSCYSVKVSDVYGYADTSITVPVKISTTATTSLKYDFYFRVYDSSNNEIYSSNWYSSTADTSRSYTATLNAGTYTVKIINYKDSVQMASSKIYVINPKFHNATVSITKTGSYYEKVKLTVSAVDKNTKSPINNALIKLKFSNGKTVTVKTNSQGKATYSVPYDAGTYTVQAVGDKYTKGSSSKKTIKIAKHKGTITISQSGKYFKNKKLTIKLVDKTTNKAIKKQTVKIKFSNGKTVTAKTNSKGVATYNVNFNPGKYTAKVTVSNKNIKINSKKLSNIKIVKLPVKITAKTVKTTYDSGKYLNIKVIAKNTKKAAKGAKVKIKIQGGKTLVKKTPSNGKIKISVSKLSIGKHKVTISLSSKKTHSGKTKSVNVVIKKASLKIKAPNTINAYKQKGTYKVKVTNKASGKAVKGIKVTMKVYTGKKYKTYTVKTNSKGIASFSTKSLSKTKHKVTAQIKATKNYKSANAKGSVKLVNKLKTRIECDTPQTGGITMYYNGMYWGTLVNHAYIPVHVYDSNGKEIYKKVSLTNPDGDVTTGTSGSESIYISTGRGTVTVKFAGDSKYFGSKTTVEI